MGLANLTRYLRKHAEGADLQIHFSFLPVSVRFVVGGLRIEVLGDHLIYERALFQCLQERISRLSAQGTENVCDRFEGRCLVGSVMRRPEEDETGR